MWVASENAQHTYQKYLWDQIHWGWAKTARMRKELRRLNRIQEAYTKGMTTVLRMQFPPPSSALTSVLESIHKELFCARIQQAAAAAGEDQKP